MRGGPRDVNHRQAERSRARVRAIMSMPPALARTRYLADPGSTRVSPWRPVTVAAIARVDFRGSVLLLLALCRIAHHQ
jgi:hypothetical protein